MLCFILLFFQFHKRAVAKDLDVLADILTHANVGKVFLIKDCVESFSSK